MARREVLTTVKGGISRLRTKGAALKDVLFDLINGYVTAARTIVIRPGTFLTQTLPSGTVGLVAFEGKLHVFSHNIVSSIPSGYVLNVLKSPDGDLAISVIHFAEPFLGALYVVAEFSDGNVYHYYLQATTKWKAAKEYKLNQFVRPTTVNGFSYSATRLGNPFPSWTPNAPRAVDDIIEPTTYSGYYFKATSVFGDNPRSGDSEPNWPTKAGAIKIEDTDDAPDIPDATPPTPPPPASIPAETLERYPWASSQ